MLIIRSRAHKYRQPRVLLVSPQPFYEDRGTPIAVSYVARALGELGCEVDLLAFPVGEHVELPGVRIHRSTKLLGIDSVPVGFSSRKAVLDVGLFQRFSQMLDSRVYDAVHAVEEAAYMAKVLCGSRGVPFVFDMASAIPEELKRHAVLGRQPLQWLLRVAEQRVLKGAAHVICSMGLASRVAKLSPLTACSEWRYPVFDQLSSGDVVAQLRQRYGFGPLDRVVLYAGTFSSYQGLDLLCDAFNIAAAKQPCMRLLCVGAGDEQIAAHWHDRIAPALRSRARFELRVPRQLMADHLALAACVISLRPLGENLPLKLFDYMASGKPIIATRGKAHGGLLNDQRAFLCDINAQSVASSIEAALSDLKLATRVGQQAQEYALRRFRWPRFVQFVEEIYEGVLEVNPGKLAQVAPGD